MKVLKSAKCQTEDFTTDSYGRRNFTKKDLKEDLQKHINKG